MALRRIVMSISRRQLMLGTLTSMAGAVAMAASDERIPAYHDEPPTGPLPGTKDPQLYVGKPEVQRVYELAGKIRPVLYQLPCYCSCDKFAGHGSLLDCFVDAHGEECSVCRHEAVFAYQQTKTGVAPKKIREKIIAGQWKKVDMSPAALASL
jgi:Protein of unknown function with PCYCGC motif